MSKTIGIVWHIFDLRCEWNFALSQAAKDNTHVVPIYCFSSALGSASLWWLKHSLESLSDDYKKLGCTLIIRKGDPLQILPALLKETKASSLYWNTSFEPKHFQLQEKLKKQNLPIQEFNSNHLIDPREIEVKPHKPYSVFTPFYKTGLKALHIPKKPPLPSKIPTPPLKSDTLKFFQEKWMQKLEHYWKPGREHATKNLHQFVKTHLKHYASKRDFPVSSATSHLSPYLHFGEISPFEIWIATKGHTAFKRQLFWREFGTYFLFHFPHAAKENWDPKFDKFKWDKSPALLKKWQQGQTGYPIVDAAMRQLWETGWMHNRLRMIVASFLTKDLFIHWKEGEKWFWDTLVDADKGNNVLGWQWTAGSGPDAAPYFRIFNPVLQSKRFDPQGTFIRKYIPELEKLPTKWIHAPWEAPPEILTESGITLGKTYPKPLVDHTKRREEALKRFKKIL